MIKSIASGLKSEHGNALLYAGLIGLIASDLIPTPADALFFFQERKLRDKWSRGEITPKQYWEKKAVSYYLYNPLWWAIVAGITVSIKGDATTKLKAMGGLIGAGAVIGVLYKNIKTDEAQLAKDLAEINELNKHKI